METLRRPGPMIITTSRPAFADVVRRSARLSILTVGYEALSNAVEDAVTGTIALLMRSMSSQAMTTPMATVWADQTARRMLSAVAAEAGEAHDDIAYATATQAFGGMSSQSTAVPVTSLATAAVAPRVSQSVTGRSVVFGQATGKAASIAQSVIGTAIVLANTTRMTGSLTASTAVQIPITAMAAQTGGKSSQSVTGSFGSTLWTPANLTTLPKVIADARQATWSGSNLSVLPNTGSNGGLFASYLGTVTKGTVVNGVAPLAFASAVLQLASQSFGSGKRVFLHVGRYNAVHGALWGLNWNANPGSFVHYPRDSGAGSRTIIYSSGTSGTIYQLPDYGDTNLHIFAEVLGSSSGQQSATRDGVARSVYSESVGAIPSAGPSTLYFGGSGPTYGPEYMSGEVLWAAVVENITPDDLLKWQGWASWTFFGDGARLPSSHPYKSAAPTA